MFGYVGTCLSHNKQGNFFFVPVHYNVMIRFNWRIWLSVQSDACNSVCSPSKSKIFVLLELATTFVAIPSVIYCVIVSFSTSLITKCITKVIVSVIKSYLEFSEWFVTSSEVHSCLQSCFCFPLLDLPILGTWLLGTSMNVGISWYMLDVLEIIQCLRSHGRYNVAEGMKFQLIKGLEHIVNWGVWR